VAGFLLECVAGFVGIRKQRIAASFRVSLIVPVPGRPD
jgi:hypothetical protein